MFSPICYNIFFHNSFVLFNQLKKNANCLNIGLKKVFFLSFPVEKKSYSEFEIRDWWNHLMNSLLIENKSAKFLDLKLT